jgi:hypothetical protein
MASAETLPDQDNNLRSPPWLGLTPLYDPQSSRPSPGDSVLKAEEALSTGRKGFWYGLGGFALAALSESLKVLPGRTAGYGIMGVGWLTWLGYYGRAQSMLDGSQPSLGETGHSSKVHTRRASTIGAIGEASNMLLIPNGLYFHPVYNDVNGGTDKFLTGSAKLGLNLSWDSIGWESVAYWRLVTPSFRKEFGLPDSEKPVGRFADWQELKTSVSGIISVGGLKIRQQFSAGFNDVGPKGGKEFHHAVHRATKNPTHQLEYTNQPEGTFWSFNEEIGLVFELCPRVMPCFHHIIAAEASQGKFMNEVGFRYNLVQVLEPKWWENAFEIRAIRQLKSQVYTHIRPWRHEAAVGARLLKVITPTVKYVSPYLYGDDIGQTYFDLLHYNYEF